MSKILDVMRTLLRIRVERKSKVTDQVPNVGARLTNDGIRMRVDSAMPAQVWQWLVLHGWQECRFRNDRRCYVDLPRGAFLQLKNAAPAQREKVHKKILAFGSKSRDRKAEKSEADTVSV